MHGLWGFSKNIKGESLGTNFLLKIVSQWGCHINTSYFNWSHSFNKTLPIKRAIAKYHTAFFLMCMYCPFSCSFVCACIHLSFVYLPVVFVGSFFNSTREMSSA